MMLHLGGGDMIPLRHIVAILDLEAMRAQDSEGFMRRHPMPQWARAAIITHMYGRMTVYPSSVSSLTLLRRSRGEAGAE